MADTLTPLLLDAKKEYMMRLSEIMAPFVIQFIDSTYRAARKEAGDRKALMEFQERLRQVPSWNAAIISQYTRDIEAKYSYFSDLVAAVFVTYVKVLSSIKISSQRPSVKLKLPTNDAFVHQVYVYAAKNFYENPYAVKETSQSKNALILTAIEAAVRNMLPLGDVLQAYLSSAVNDDHTVNPVLSPAQSDDEEEDTFTTQQIPESSDSESDFGDAEEKVIEGIQAPTSTPTAPVTEQPVISPINLPFPSPATTPAPPPSYPVQPPSYTPSQPQPQSQPQPPHVPPQSRPLFDDATDGEHQFR